MAVDISNVININISTSPTLLSNENVNIIGIFTREKSLFPIDNYAIYKNPNSCMSDWGIDSMTYKMVNNIFSQNLNILAGGGYVVVFPMLDEISLQATAGSYIISNLLLDKWQSVNNGSFTIQVDGGEEKAINNLDFTNAKTLEEVGEIIQASLEDATVSVNKKTLVITSKTTGANSSIVITEGAEGTDLADVDYLNVKQAIEEKGQNAYEGEERLQDAVARTKDYTFYEAILTTFDSADDEVLATAELIQPLNKMFFAVSNKLSDVSSVFDIIRQKSFTKTRCLYYGGEDYKLFASGYASKLLSVNFNGSGTANNLAVKEIIGLLPDNTVNDNLLMQLQETGVDCYANIKGLGTIMTSGANEWSDTVLFLNWLKNALEVAGYNTLRAVPTKIAQTETGVEQLKNSYINVLEQAIRLGYMAPGKWLLPFTFGDQELFYNNIEQVGYYVYSEPIVNQTQNERDKRKAPLIQMAIKLAGAINSSSVIVYVNN